MENPTTDWQGTQITTAKLPLLRTTELVSKPDPRA